MIKIPYIINNLSKAKKTMGEIYNQATYSNQYEFNIENTRYNISRLNRSDNDSINIFFHGYTAIKSQLEYENLTKQINFNEHNDASLVHWDSGNLTKTIALTTFEKILTPSISPKSPEKQSILSKISLAIDTINDQITIFGNDFKINQEKTITISKEINKIIEYNIQNNKYSSINLIGHSLGARIVLNGLEHISDEYKHLIKNIIVMGGAISWDDMFNKYFDDQSNSKLYNLYSSNDYVLICKPDKEKCIGNFPIQNTYNNRIINICCDKFRHTDYWPNFQKLCNEHHLLS